MLESRAAVLHLAFFPRPCNSAQCGMTTQCAAPASRTPDTPVTDDAIGPDDFSSPGGLYDRHATRVFSLALRIVREVGAAEDVVQEVFLQAWTQRRRYDRARGPVDAWLLMLTRSRAIDRIRASRRDGGQPGPSFDCASLAAPAIPHIDDVRVIRDALAMLPTEQRHPLELAFYEGYTHSEIAVILRQPLGTVKTRIRRAIHTLRTAIQSPRPALAMP